MDFSPRQHWEGEDRKKILDLIYRFTHADFKGVSGERWGSDKGYPSIVVNHNGATALILLRDLSDEQINSRLDYVAYSYKKEAKLRDEKARNKVVSKASLDVVRLLVPGIRTLTLKAAASYVYEQDTYLHVPVVATFDVEGKPATSLTEFTIRGIRSDYVVEQQALALVTHHKGESGDPVLMERLDQLLLGIAALATTQQRIELSYNL